MANDETELLQLFGDVLGLGEVTAWGIDLADGGAGLVIALLLSYGQHLLYIPGRAVNRASEGYRGDAKTDAQDAAVIADQARIRRDLMPMKSGDELITELKVLTSRRRDLADDRTRAINRLRGHLTGIFPGLERELDLGNVGPLMLLTGYQTPAAIRRTGAKRLATWLGNRKVRGADQLAAKAVQAAEGQHTAVPGEKITAQVVHSLAREVMALNEKIAETDKLIEGRFRQHQHAEAIAGMPGIGPLLGAEFLAATGGEMNAFDSADRLAGFAGVAPNSRDSGKISGNLHRPALQPPPPTRLLHLRVDQHPLLRRVPPVLRPQARRRQTARPSRPRARPPPSQRPMGPAA